jgi:hypothetical protein
VVCVFGSGSNWLRLVLNHVDSGSDWLRLIDISTYMFFLLFKIVSSLTKTACPSQDELRSYAVDRRKTDVICRSRNIVAHALANGLALMLLASMTWHSLRSCHTNAGLTLPTRLHSPSSRRRRFWCDGNCAVGRSNYRCVHPQIKGCYNG